jgi:hypothetical protein
MKTPGSRAIPSYLHSFFLLAGQVLVIFLRSLRHSAYDIDRTIFSSSLALLLQGLLLPWQERWRGRSDLLLRRCSVLRLLVRRVLARRCATQASLVLTVEPLRTLVDSDLLVFLDDSERLED